MHPAHALAEKLSSLDKVQGRRLYSKLESMALEFGLWSELDGNPVPLTLTASPWFLRRDQMDYVSRASWQMRQALKTMTRLWYENSKARDLLPLTAREAEFFQRLGEPAGLAEERFFCRLDALCHFGSKDWVDGLFFLENNVVGIGGMTYAPAAALIVDRIFHILSIPCPNFRHLPDPRRLLAEELFGFAFARGMQGEITVALLDDQNQYRLGGEMERLARSFRGVGIHAVAVDARELELDSQGDLRAGDLKVDLVYRFVELRDLLETSDDDQTLNPLWTAFQRGIVVPSLAGDLDHKSTFELLTSEEFASYFTPDLLEVFRRHVPWTRLLFERHTKSPRGETIDLFDYAEHNRNGLVLKPNRDCGGVKVVLGNQVTESQWHQALEEAAVKPRTFVIQESIPLVQEQLPVLQENGEVDWSSRFLSLGLFPTARETGAFGRFSDGAVVNISQSGGVVPLIILEE